MNLKVLILFTLTLCINRTLKASQLTTVTASKAIIYADRQLSTPIGYLPAGKKVRVGEGLKRGGKILPILIEGKITYILVADLAIREKYQGVSSAKHKVEHNTNSQFSNKEDKLSENIFMIATLSNFSASQEISQDGTGTRVSSSYEEKNDEDESITSLSEYTIYIEHRQPYGRLSWGIGLGFLKSLKLGETLQGLLLRGTIKASLFKTRLITFELAFEPYFSGDINLGTVEALNPDNPNDKLEATLYGYRFAAQVTLFPLYKFGAVAGIGIEKSYFSQISSTDQINNYTLTLSSNVIYAGLTCKF